MSEKGGAAASVEEGDISSPSRAEHLKNKFEQG